MKSNTRTISTLQLTLAMILMAFAGTTFAQQGIANPVISDVWVKATVPGSTVSAAYMQIKSATPLKLVKAASPAAGIVEIHDMKMKDGVMEMKAMDALDVPAGTTVELKPGSVHVMMMKVKKPISKGDKVPLTLTFEGAGSKPVVVTLDAIARESSPSGMMH